MRTIHVPFSFYPDPAGGTEVYVESLVRNLRQQGVDVIVAAPSEESTAYTHAGLPVRRFAVSPVAGLRELYGEGDVIAAEGFARILDEERPDLVHLHAFTRAVSLRLVRAAKQRGLPVVFTYHTPTVSCQRGTLMRWGTETCDGELDLGRCTRCVLHSHGPPRPVAEVVGRVPAVMGDLLGAAGLSGGPWTTLRMCSLIRRRHAAVRQLLVEVDHVVALCHWTKELLERNGVPGDKVTVSHHGLPRPANDDSARQEPVAWKQGERLRIAFLGRLHPTKGPDLLVEAVRALPAANVELNLYGIAQGAAGEDYLRELKALAAGDGRINFCRPVPGNEVIPLLREHHLLAVPSRVLETGPLVVLEAFAARIPVVGSDLGGIAELVSHEENGLLVTPPASCVAWSQALRLILEDDALLSQLRRNVHLSRTMDAVRDEMCSIYRQIIQSSK